MDPQIVVRATGDFRRLYSDLDKGEARFGRFGSKAKAAVAGAAVAGTAAVVKLGIESVKSASASQQSLGATQTVFGKYANTVIKRSQQAADAVGLSANEYRELGNVTGAMLQNSGAPLREVTGLTQKLTKRAADLAATYGGTTKEAIESVNSLLRGEADPIERYGVSIKQADVNARLAAKGLDKLEGSAKKQAEQQARLELLFRQTAKAAGQFDRESDTLAGSSQRLGAKVDDLEAKFGQLLIPALTDAATWAGDVVVPALEDLADWLSENKDEFGELGTTIKDQLLPPLKAGADIVETAVDVFGALPPPVKELAVEAGLAAMVLPKLSAAVQSVSAMATTMAGNITDAETRTKGLAQAARSAAGIGGMLALTQSVTTSNDAISAVSTVAGGALLGFSVGGPWGAAIGAGAGAFAGLARNTDDAVDSTEALRIESEKYMSILNQVTGAVTQATKATALKRLEDSGALATGIQLGLTQRQLVNAAVGQEGATRKLNNALFAAGVVFDDTGAAVLQYDDANRLMQGDLILLSQVVGDNTRKVDENAKKVRDAARATLDLTALQGKVPKRVYTAIEATGINPTVRGIAKVAEKYGLLPEQVQAVIDVTGVETSVRDVGKVREQLRNVADEPGKQASKAKAGSRKLGKAIPDGATEGLVPGLKALKRELKSGVDRSTAGAQGPATTGGLTVGGNLGLGMYQGLGVWIGPVTQRAVSMVREAVAGAKREGKIESPSKETDYLGQMLGQGLADGMARTTGKNKKAAGALVKSVVSSITGGLAGADKALAAVTRTVEKGIKGKKDEQREKRVLKNLRDQYAAIRANGRAQDALESGSYLRYLSKASKLYKDMTRAGVANLQEARDALKSLTDQYAEYARAARDAVVATGNITQLGRGDDGTVTLKGLLDELSQKVIGAERFDVLVQQLAKQGLSQTSIDQMLAAGPDAALATAEAIATGGKAAIAQMNDLQSRLGAAGDRLGAAMAKRYYGAGVEAAKGVVAGLESQDAALDRAATRLGKNLVKAVRKALRSNSPSKEFEDIADDVTGGLTLQLDANQTYVKRSGQGMATALVKGFSTPKLAADVLAGGGRAGAAGVQRVELRLTAEQLSAAQRGKAILVDIDAARTAGARAKAVTL